MSEPQIEVMERFVSATSRLNWLGDGVPAHNRRLIIEAVFRELAREPINLGLDDFEAMSGASRYGWHAVSAEVQRRLMRKKEPEFPASSPLFALGEDLKTHFANAYGYSVTTHEPKGIIVLKIEEEQPKLSGEK